MSTTCLDDVTQSILDQELNLIPERVDRGVAWLDTEVSDWRSRIDVDTLDLRNEEECVLAQVFGGYNHGLFCLTGSYRYSVETTRDHGFTQASDAFGEDYDALRVYWEALTTEWKARLRRP